MSASATFPNLPVRRQPCKHGVFVFLCIVIYLLASCKKKDSAASLPPVVISDTASFKITNATKTDVNEFDIHYLAKPPVNELYSDIYLVWSTSSDFSHTNDSASIAATGASPVVHHLSRLKQSTRYYGRIGLNYKGKRFYSPVREFITETFKILVVGYTDPPRGFSKDDTSVAFTNFLPVAPRTNSDTKVYFGNYECPLVSDQGLTIEFNVPALIPAGKYIFRIFSRGMEAQWPDSIEVLRGKWSNNFTSPVIPVNPNASTAGLVFFGTCYSPQKGYLVGGIYLNGPQVPFPNSMWPEYIIEFDGQLHSWTKRNVANPRYFENPLCYYYNNGIYVVGGHQLTYDILGTHGMSVKKIQRLDLSSLTWSDVTDVPYPTMFNVTGFELNNEWYIGMGADSANRSLCCGTPIPSKKFWKYNPGSNQWAQLADFPGGHQNFPTCFSIGSKGYAFYGNVDDVAEPTTANEQLWEYNPQTNSWSNIVLTAGNSLTAGEKYQVSVHNGKAYFISCQRREIYALGYGYRTYAPCLEWDPGTNVFKKVAFPYDAYILKTIFKQGNTFFYYSDATGYFESVPKRTFSFSIEQ